MDERAAAERWVAARLEQARTAFRQQPPGPGQPGLAAYERRLRRLVAVQLRPTGQYVGRGVAQAQELAREAGDVLCVHRGATGHRADWRAERVHVQLGADGTVRSAARDPRTWA